MTRLLEERSRQCLTQAELARRSGVSQKTISKIELGSKPRSITIGKLARALGVDVNHLINAGSFMEKAKG